MRIRWVVFLLSLSAAGQPPRPAPAIRVDQAGYLAGSRKLAIVAVGEPAAEFAVRRAGDGQTVFHGRLGQPTADADSGDRVQVADFSAFRQAGRYFLEVPGVGRSCEFEIGARTYDRVLYLAMRSYYGQRCGTDVDLGPDYPGYRYDACHRTGAWHESSGRSGQAPSVKGWHDAGDYGRYIVNSGITTGTLLWTFELYRPVVEKLSLKIPESGNQIPDFLDEIRWNLEWMMTMQDADGGVWHKQTSERFAPFVMPDQDTMVSYIIGTGAAPYKSTCATADFAAVMAAAARIYPRYDADFARRALSAAEAAWRWADEHPSVLFANPRGVTTGAYGDRNCSDEMLWAAAELWRTTRKEKYARYFLDHWEEFRTAIAADNPPAWPQVAPLALWGWALARGPRADEIRGPLLAAADALAQRTAGHAYRVSLLRKDYVWGSNAVVANYGMQLLVAHRLQPKPAYFEGALDNLHYLLGRNPMSVCYVTRVGANPVRHPHHRPSAADGHEEPWPGLLAGGPNARRQDPAMKKLPEGTPPAKMYLDEQESYATNEVAINWNAPLVFLLAGVIRGN